MSLQMFQTQWAIYEKIIHKNYMFHEQILNAVEKILKEIGENTPIEMLDLGCGDVTLISKILPHINLEGYTGFDLSSSSLEIAKKNLQSVVNKVLLKSETMENCFNIQKQWNVVYSSYAIHHLQDLDKKKLILKLVQGLPKNGLFIYIDIFKKEDETMLEYKQRYMQNIATYWDSIELYEKEIIFNHINESDFPTDISTIKDWLSEINIKPSNIIQFDDCHKLVLVKK